MTVQNMILKMSRLIEKEFGCSVSITDFDGAELVGSASPEHLEVAVRNSAAPRIYAGNDVIIPVREEEKVLGVVSLVGGFNVRAVHVEKLERILSDALKKAYCGEPLSESVEELEKYIDSLSVPENVIFISDVKLRRRQNLKEHGLNHETLAGRPVFLHSKKSEELQKLAVDIHREMGSIGFVPWFALDHQNLPTVESLRELGPITIFVSDLEDLTCDQQKIVEDLLSESSRENTPQFIFGSQKTLSELMTARSVTEGLGRILEKSI